MEQRQPQRQRGQVQRLQAPHQELVDLRVRGEVESSAAVFICSHVYLRSVFQQPAEGDARVRAGARFFSRKVIGSRDENGIADLQQTHGTEPFDVHQLVGLDGGYQFVIPLPLDLLLEVLKLSVAHVAMCGNRAL